MSTSTDATVTDVSAVRRRLKHKPPPSTLLRAPASGTGRSSSSGLPSFPPLSSSASADLLVSIERSLPRSYNFEVVKTIARIRRDGCRRVALQMPEGLLAFAGALSDIINRYCNNAQVIIMSDVTYGACCIDDYTARALDADLIIHYGHSCLNSVQTTTVNTQYVFVEISIDTRTISDTLISALPSQTRLALAATVQFIGALHTVTAAIQSHFVSVYIPQCKPLSGGEVLGCTSPTFSDVDAVVFIADGRFHLESIMIANPSVSSFYKFDPYALKLTRERYDYDAMTRIRQAAIMTAANSRYIGVILGTLGRQGSTHILDRMTGLLRQRNIEYDIILLSEITPAKLRLMDDFDCFIQIACPRLSIDWGSAFDKPLLSSYEAEVMLRETAWRASYPMDYYSANGGSWSSYAHQQADKAALRKGGGAASASTVIRYEESRVH